MLKIRKIHHRTTYSITTDDGSEVEAQYEPCDWMDVHAERIGDKLVIAYNSHDDDGHSSNPMENNDCQGNIYTKPSRYGGGVITDDMSELLSALQLDGENEVRPRARFEIDGISASLEDHAVTSFMEVNYGHDLTDEYIFDVVGQEPDKSDEDRSITLRDEVETAILNGEFKCDEHQAEMLRLYAKHWREIVGPYVVPVDWCENNHGPGTTSACVTTWDGDPDDLPDGVWVADKDAIENIDSSSMPAGVDIRWEGALSVEGSTLHAVVSKDGVDVHDAGTESGSWGRALAWACKEFGNPKPTDLVATAEKYAESILSEYVSWCNGDVYGCCVETFQKVGEDDDQWEQIDEDACWGFIGSDHAQQALIDEFFKRAVARISV